MYKTAVNNTTNNLKENLDLVSDIFKMSECIICDISNNKLTVVSTNTKSEIFKTGQTIDLSVSLMNDIVKSQDIVTINNISNDKKNADCVEFKNGLIALIGLPLFNIDNEIVGVICLFAKREMIFSKIQIDHFKLLKKAIEVDFTQIVDLRKINKMSKSNDIEKAESKWNKTDLMNFIQSNVIHSMINSLPGIFFMYKKVNGVFRLIYWNKNHETFTGYTFEELENKSALDFFTPQNQPFISSGINKMLENGTASLEANIRLKDGSEVVCLFEACAIDIVGELYFIGVGLDVSELKKTEQKLVESEKNLNTIINQSPISITYYSKEGTILKVNERALKLYGINNINETFGYNLFDDQHLTDDVIQRLKNGKIQEIIVDFDFDKIKKNKILPTSKSGKITIKSILSATFSTSQELTGFIEQTIDITEEVRNKKLLQESENKYKILFKSAGDATMLFHQHKIIACNDRALSILKGVKEDILGLTPWDISPEKQLDGQFSKNKALEYIENSKVGIPAEFEWQHKTLKNELLDIDVTLSLLNKEANTYIATWRDITERKKLEEQTLLYKKSIDIASDAAIWIDSEGRFMYVNDSACSMLGYTEQELMQKTIFDINPKTSPQRWSETWESIKFTKTFTKESVHQCKDGSVIPVEIVSTYIKLGEKEYLNGFARDISERVKAHEEILASESKYRTLIENIPQKIFLKNLDSLYVSVNNRLAKDLGLSQSEIVGKSDYDFFPKELADSYKADDFRVIKSGQTVEIEEKYLQNGIERWIHTIKTPVKNSRGDIEGILGIFWDITDKKNAENELKISEEKFHKAFLASPYSMSITRLGTGEFIEINEGFTKNTGYAAEEVIGKTSAELNLWSNQEFQKINLYEELQKEGRVRNFEVELVAKDGSIINSMLNAEIIILNDEKYLLTIGNNVTELKKTNTELNKYKTNLEELVEQRTNELKKANKQLKSTQQQLIHSEKMASIGLLSAGIAHEINNPVNYISGGIAGLKKTSEYLKKIITDFFEECHETKNKHKFMKELNMEIETMDKMFYGINKGVQKTVNIINSMKAFSSNSENNFVKVSIKELFNTVLTILYNLYKDRVTFQENYDDNSVIIAIPGKLQQAFMNIISNAIMAIPGKGKISITTKWNKEKNTLSISIKDNGTGMSSATQKRIFEPFFSSRQVGKGTGLGLYLTYSYIKQHNGKIVVNSVEGSGSEFIIELPNQI